MTQANPAGGMPSNQEHIQQLLGQMSHALAMQRQQVQQVQQQQQHQQMPNFMPIDTNNNFMRSQSGQLTQQPCLPPQNQPGAMILEGLGNPLLRRVPMVPLLAGENTRVSSAFNSMTPLISQNHNNALYAPSQFVPQQQQQQLYQQPQRACMQVQGNGLYQIDQQGAPVHNQNTPALAQDSSSDIDSNADLMSRHQRGQGLVTIAGGLSAQLQPTEQQKSFSQAVDFLAQKLHVKRQQKAQQLMQGTMAGSQSMTCVDTKTLPQHTQQTQQNNGTQQFHQKQQSQLILNHSTASPLTVTAAPLTMTAAANLPTPRQQATVQNYQEPNSQKMVVVKQQESAEGIRQKPEDPAIAANEDSSEEEVESIFEYKLRQKRGKKAQSLQEYSQYVKEKIDELNLLIRDPSTSIEDRKKYRNQKTSYNARLRNRNHTTQITSQLSQQDEEIKELMEIVKSCIAEKQLTAIGAKVKQKMPQLAMRVGPSFGLSPVGQATKKQRRK